jgi:hypothetical protein
LHDSHLLAEGKDYYEKVLNDPAQMPEDIVFEPLLYIADDAFEIKMNVPFNYMPTYNYETQSNRSGLYSIVQRKYTTKETTQYKTKCKIFDHY